MLRSVFFILLPVTMVFFISCGNSEKLDISGDPEAINMAENMVKALGGRNAWTKISSVYIRTLKAAVVSDQTMVLEEWINLDGPKFIDRTMMNDAVVVNIVNHNDGWKVQEGQVAMLPPASVTNYLNWYDQFLLVNLRKLAIGGEGTEVKTNGPRRFDMYFAGTFKCSFEIDDSFLPKKYYSVISGKKLTILEIDDYNEYKGYKFPLKLSEEGSMTIYKTDYFDPSPKVAEKAFPISFDPQQMAAKQ